MDRTTYLLRELSAWQRRVGRNAEQTRQETGQVNERLGDEAARNDETDAALVEVGGIAADNAATGEEIMAAQVELAGLVDTALARADEQDAALVELAGMIAAN